MRHSMEPYCKFNAITKMKAHLTKLRSSPTAYNVFTAFAVNIESTSGDQCVTETGETTILATAYSEEIADNPGTVTLGAAGEQDFVTKFLTLPNCRPQSANVVPPTALLPVLSLTSTVTLQYPTVTRQTRISIAPVSFLRQVPFFSLSFIEMGRLSALGRMSFRTLTHPNASYANSLVLFSLSFTNFSILEFNFPCTFIVGPLITVIQTSTLYKTNQSGSTTLTSAVGTTTLTSVVGTFTAIPEVASSSEGGSVSGSESTSGPKTTTSRIASAPLVIVGNSTITPDRNPVTLPFYTATSVGSVSNGVVIVVPTGTGSQAGNYTAIVPYISNSGSFRRGYFWTSLWAATLSGIGLVMVWL